MSAAESPARTQPPANDGDPIVIVTEKALARIAEVRAGEDDPESLVLRIAISGASGPEYSYDLSFEDSSDRREGDVQYEAGDLPVVVPVDSVDKLRGATLDIPSHGGSGGLVIRNPNRPNPLAGADLELTGDVADKVHQLLAEAINPSLAGHGGYAALVGVDGTKVFVTMGGGCQGCALSAATLREGIQAAIKEAIPEVTEVIDTTDHTAGDNPFYSRDSGDGPSFAGDSTTD